jgi:hypothetical protein
MIHETVMDKSLNHLMAHFGPRVVLRPPAAAAELASLEALVGSLPRDYILFLTTCNGLRVELTPGAAATQLMCVHDVLETCGSAHAPSIPAGFVPLSGQPDGSTDWLVLTDEPLHGMVLRWEPGQHGEEILASSFGHYFDNWTRYLTVAFDRRGRRTAGKRLEFDAAFCAQTDARISQLQRSPAVCESMAELELRAAAGEDFE